MTNKKSKKINLIVILVFILITSISLNTNAAGGATVSTKGLMPVIQESVSLWYFILRYFSIALMLVIFIYLGIRLAISSIAEDKAKYKRLLMDWLVGFIIIFTIHYFMILILKLNDICVDLIKKVSSSLASQILTPEEIALGMNPSTQGLYETVRTRAYELRFSIGTSGMIMYMVLVYYTVRFIIVYFKRFFTVLILTIMAPLMGLFYAFNKINSGKSAILTKWAEEYAFNVLLQTIHALMYGCFVQIALVLSTKSIVGFVFALIMLNFMLKAEGYFRKIFKFSANIADENTSKGIKENLSALTAMKASAATMFGGQMAKDAGAAVKRGIGAITNGAFIGGVYLRDKSLSDERLEKKKEEKEKLDKELTKQNEENKAKTEEEKKKLEEKLEKREKLEKQIARMEKRRKDIKKYKGGIKDPERLESRIEYATRGITDEKKKQEIRKEILEKNKEKIVRRYVHEDKRTGRKQVIDGAAVRLKGNINTKLWGNNAVKSSMKDMVKTTTTGIKGIGQILVGMPLIVTEPSIGMALLAKGMKDADKLFGNSEYRKVATFNERRSIHKIQKRNRKISKKTRKQERKNRKYTFNRFNPHSLETIKSEMRMDKKLNSIRNSRVSTLGNLALTGPLRLLGVTGGIRTIQAKAYKAEEARRDYNLKLETFMMLEKKESINKEHSSLYEKSVSNIRKGVQARLAGDAVIRYKQDAGKIFTVGEKTFKFDEEKFELGKPTDIKTKKAKTNKETPTNTEETKEVLSQKAILDNLVLTIAAKNKVFDLKDLNLDSEIVREQIVEKMQEAGLADATTVPEELNAGLEQIQERIEEISKNNPNAVEEKLAKDIIIEYMQEKGIEDETEIKKTEHRKAIKAEIISIIEAEEQRREELIEEPESSETTEVRTKIEEKFEKFVIKKQKAEKREKREATLDALISSLEKVDPVEEVAEEVAKLAESDEGLQEEIERLTLIEKTEKIDKPLLGLEELLININKEKVHNAFETIAPKDEEELEEEGQQLIEEYMENNGLDQRDLLVRNLLESFEQNKIAIELKVKPDDKERKRLEEMDLERINSTYKKEYKKGSKI